VIDLSKGFCGIRNQGNLGSCTAMTICAILEYVINRTTGQYGNAHPWLSVYYNYFFNRSSWDYVTTSAEFLANPNTYPVEGRRTPQCMETSHHPNVRDCDCGSNTEEMHKSLKEFGCCTEQELPYATNHDLSRINDQPNYKHQPNKKYICHRILPRFAQYPKNEMMRSARELYSRYISEVAKVPCDLSAWIAELYNENPLSIGINSSQSFSDANNVSFFHNGDSGRLGGHRVVLVGYDPAFIPDPSRPDVKVESFKIRNSWGSSWGDNGYIWISRQCLSNMMQNTKAIVLRPRDPFHTLPGAPSPSPPNEPFIRPGSRPNPPTGNYLFNWWFFPDQESYRSARQNHLRPQQLNTGHSLQATPQSVAPNVVFSSVDVSIIPQPHTGVIALGACFQGNQNFWKWHTLGDVLERPVAQQQLALPELNKEALKVLKSSYENLDKVIRKVKKEYDAGANIIWSSESLIEAMKSLNESYSDLMKAIVLLSANYTAVDPVKQTCATIIHLIKPWQAFLEELLELHKKKAGPKVLEKFLEKNNIDYKIIPEFLEKHLATIGRLLHV